MGLSHCFGKFVSKAHQSEECSLQQGRRREISICTSCCSITKSCPTLWPHRRQYARLPCPSLSPRVCSQSCPLSGWCHPPILSSVAPFSSCPPSFPASGSFPMNPVFASGCQSVAASASASVLPVNIQGQLPLGLTGLISLLSKGLSKHWLRVWKHWFFGAQPSLWFSSHIRVWPLEKT